MHGLNKATTHTEWVHVIAELTEKAFSNHVVSICTYGKMRARSGRVGVYLQTLAHQKVCVTAKTTIGQVQAANCVPNMLAPVNRTAMDVTQGEVDTHPNLEDVESRDFQVRWVRSGNMKDGY